MIETELSGRRLSPDDVLPFRCHAGLACFNSCCRDKRLTLLPFDVLRLSRGLGRATHELLAEHAELEIEPGSGWPTLRIRLAAGGRCPFVGEQGCRVYRDRPTCCRIYPLARAVALGSDGAPTELFFAEASTQCLGFDAEETQSVEAWTRTQGLGSRAIRSAPNGPATALASARQTVPEDHETRRHGGRIRRVAGRHAHARVRARRFGRVRTSVRPALAGRARKVSSRRPS